MKAREQFIYQTILEEPGIYGVPLRQECCRVWQKDVSFGELYALLGSLEDAGYICGENAPGDGRRGGREKRLWYAVRAEKEATA